mmetsp:Transcript_26576/g.51101  ORF Transcript_26576/g.51101 Transcript_26576/m.51101 type:complete len:83 (+) Transcript_26576:998-1246(+)
MRPQSLQNMFNSSNGFCRVEAASLVYPAAQSTPTLSRANTLTSRPQKGAGCKEYVQHAADARPVNGTFDDRNAFIFCSVARI